MEPRGAGTIPFVPARGWGQPPVQMCPHGSTPVPGSMIGGIGVAAAHTR